MLVPSVRCWAGKDLGGAGQCMEVAGGWRPCLSPPCPPKSRSHPGILHGLQLRRCLREQPAGDGPRQRWKEKWGTELSEQTLLCSLTRRRPRLEKLKIQNCRSNRHWRGNPLPTGGQGQATLAKELPSTRATSDAMQEDLAT